MGQERRLDFGDADRTSTSRLRSSREAGAAEASTTSVAMTLKRMVPFPMVPFHIRQGARSGAAPVGPAVTSDLLPRRRGHENPGARDDGPGHRLQRPARAPAPCTHRCSASERALGCARASTAPSSAAHRPLPSIP